MPKSVIIRQMNEISNSKVASSSLLRLQKTASSLDSRFADHTHTQIVPPLRQEDSTCTKPVARVNEIHSVGGKTQKPIFGGLV